MTGGRFSRLVMFGERELAEFSPKLTLAQFLGVLPDALRNQVAEAARTALRAAGLGSAFSSAGQDDAELGMVEAYVFSRVMVVDVFGLEPNVPSEVVHGVWVTGFSGDSKVLSIRMLIGSSMSESALSEVSDGMLRIGFRGIDHITPTSVSSTDADAASVGTAVVIGDGYVEVVGSGLPVFVNGIRQGLGRYGFGVGDCVWVGFGLRVTLGAGFVTVDGAHTSRLPGALWAPRRPVGFPLFKRPPRHVFRAPTDVVEVDAPPVTERKGMGALVKLIVPPLISAGAMAGVGLLMGRGMMMLMTGAMAVITTIVSVGNFISERRKAKTDDADARREYAQYLDGLRARLDRLHKAQVKAASYHNLCPAEIGKALEEFSSRAFERTPVDQDFLTVSLGTAPQATTYKVNPPDKDKTAKTKTSKKRAAGVGLDQQMMDVVGAHRQVQGMPVVVDLKNAHLGLVGDPSNVRVMVSQLLLQIAFFQSYHDVEVIVLTSASGKEAFEWARWLPHARLAGVNVATVVCEERHRDQVLGSLGQVLKNRALKTSEHKRDSRFLPHYVFVVDDPTLVVDHSIMEHLQQPTSQLGFSLIWSTGTQANLPENIGTIARIDGKSRAVLVMNEARTDAKHLTPYTTTDVDFGIAARRLAAITHVPGVSTQIPEAVTFFGLLGIERPEQIPVAQHWANAAPHKTLAVPLGLRGKDDIVNLDLHEQAHGPHGLVAGTTGSGKSEIVQSYILSLAAHFSPHDVGFLLIDYKGGGMANLFVDLPHMLGTITNLDGAGSMRALASIRAELARRQTLFNQVGVNNINAYTKAFKAQQATGVVPDEADEVSAMEPLPHLFIISDEFAELKKEQPEFMAELVSTARIGRSLGVHLILATQKPTGVVDDQIWSNSKFKLALKVANESDSNEILKTPDAARITQPGRAYLQVGNNEVYELFQSAWSGAPYMDGAKDGGVDRRVWVINELGQGEIANQDLSTVDPSADASQDQLAVMVEHIAQVHAELDLAPVAKPWLPPLAEQLITPTLTHIAGEVAPDTEQGASSRTPSADGAALPRLGVSVGLVDDPGTQAQFSFVHDFGVDGNLAVFGGPASGKTTTLATIVLSLAALNAPTQCQFQVFDYGNSGLAVLDGLPHVANYLGLDDTERLGKVVKQLSGEIKARKRAFAAVRAHSHLMFNQLAAERSEPLLPAVVVVVDNFDAVAEVGEHLSAFLVKLARDGASLGMFVAVSATRLNALKLSMQATFKRKFTFALSDSADIPTIVGRTSLDLDGTPGRALVNLGEPVLMQCFLPTQHEGDLAYAARIRDLVATIANRYSDAPPAVGVKVTPETVTLKHLEHAWGPEHTTVGLCVTSTDPIGLDLTIPLHLVIGKAGSGKTNLLQLIATQHKDRTGKLFIADSPSAELANFAEGHPYLDDPSEAEEFVAALRKHADQLAKQRGKTKLRDFVADVGASLLVIDDVDSFGRYLGTQVAEVVKIITKGMENGLVVAVAANTKVSTMAGAGALLKNVSSGIVLAHHEAGAAILPTGLTRDPDSGVGIGFHVRSGKTRKIKIPVFQQELQEA